jgi:hypothetical protein
MSNHQEVLKEDAAPAGPGEENQYQNNILMEFGSLGSLAGGIPVPVDNLWINP